MRSEVAQKEKERRILRGRRQPERDVEDEQEALVENAVTLIQRLCLCDDGILDKIAKKN